MQEKKKKKAPWGLMIMMGISVLVGAACGIFAVQYAQRIGSSEDQLLFLLPLFLGLYAGIFAQTVLHEAGHLVFGLLSGYRFSSFRIGSFMWLKEKGRIVLRRLSLAGTGGQCLMIPPELTDGRMPVILSNLGGCIMNLIASAIFFLVYLLVPEGSFLSAFLLAIVAVGIIIALTNGIPLRMGAVDNDGYNALSLGKDRQALYAFWLQLKVNGETANGVRLKDMPEEWFSTPSDDAMGNSIIAAQAALVCNRLMDQHRFEEADRLMDHLLTIQSGLVGLHRGLLISDRMYCEAILETRQSVLAEMLTKEQAQFMKAMRNYPSVIRTVYVCALLSEQDTAKAETAKKLFEKIAKTHPYPSDIRSDRELMEIAASLAKDLPV